MEEIEESGGWSGLGGNIRAEGNVACLLEGAAKFELWRGKDWSWEFGSRVG